MRVLRDVDACPRPPQGTAVTIGAYDGLHIGHRAVIAELRRRAEQRGLASAVVTFDRHPAMVVRPESAPRLLTDLDQKLALLESTGVDYTLVIHFDERRSHEPAEDFVREVLVDCLNAKTVVVGEDFHFGYQRKGHVELLRSMGEDLGFDVDGFTLVGTGTGTGDGEIVSSTAIRRALVAGDLATANAMLGRPYEVRGVVREGSHRGTELGFPTANLSVSGDILLPADGIYAGWFVRADGDIYPAAMNLGRRPEQYATSHASLLEVHVLDFEGELNGEHAAARFVSRLRPAEHFDSQADLVAQIERDCRDARAALDGDHPAQ